MDIDTITQLKEELIDQCEMAFNEAAEESKKQEDLMNYYQGGIAGINSLMERIEDHGKNNQPELGKGSQKKSPRKKAVSRSRNKA